MEHSNKQKELLINLIKKETIPAVGCTEPVAVAIAAATARKYLHDEIKKMKVNVSLNIFKNGKSVIIPGTTRSGLDLAAALGTVVGNSENGLLIFKNVNDDNILKAEEMLKNNMVELQQVSVEDAVFVEVFMESEKDKVDVILNKCHTHINMIKVNEKIIYEDKELEDSLDSNILEKLTLKDLREIIEEVDIDKILFLLERAELNKTAAYEGLKLDKEFNVGATLYKLQCQGEIANDVATRARILTAAGADFRMGGGSCPIMTSGGSGNQGIGIVLPIIVAGEHLKCSDESICRALFLGNLLNLYVKSYTGKLSAMCGCAIASGIGSSAGISWLMGGNDEQISGAVRNMLANLTGMICDGAKLSCALKLSTSAEEAVISAYLACNNTIVSKDTGIVGDTAEQTIKNIGILCSEGFSDTDQAIVNIMYKKII